MAFIEASDKNAGRRVNQNLLETIEGWTGENDPLPDRLVVKSIRLLASILSQQAERVDRIEDYLEEDSEGDVRTLAGIISRQTERIELLEAAVLGLADETPDPADAELEGLVE
jgi:hypothetical protein